MRLPKDGGHPIYATIRLGIAMVALTTILWFTASSFDFTEVRTIILMFLDGATSEGFLGLIKTKFGQ